ncbi:MAG: glycosyltransferase family 4 protein [Spirochaetes bacterium]|nr:glycosyltransferase family 4 protein [Spirochaetota bacterium]
MNILQVIASGGLGGREMQPVKLAEMMREKGHNTYLLVRKGSLSIPLIKEKGLPYDELKMDGYLNFRSLIPLAKILKEKKIDVIHTHISRSLLFLHLARILSKRKIKLIFTQRMGMNVKKDDIYHWFIFNRVDQIISVSEYVKARFLKAAPFLKDKIKVVYNGIGRKEEKVTFKEKKRFQKEFGLKKRTVKIGLVAQLNAGKGHMWTIRAAKLLKEKYKYENFKIFFVGKGEWTDSIKDFARTHDIASKVIFAGFRWDVDYFYRNFDIALIPSKSEAGGNVIIEAMAFGKPVICSDTGYFPEVIESGINGLMVRYDDTLSLTEAMYQLIKNASWRKKLGKKARETVQKKFLYDNTVKNYIRIYTETAGK